MECTDGWLQPILSRIASDRSVVCVPLIDGISSDNLGYGASSSLSVTRLRWSLIFSWSKTLESLLFFRLELQEFYIFFFYSKGCQFLNES